MVARRLGDHAPGPPLLRSRRLHANKALLTRDYSAWRNVRPGLDGLSTALPELCSLLLPLASGSSYRAKPLCEIPVWLTLTNATAASRPVGRKAVAKPARLPSPIYEGA